MTNFNSNKTVEYWITYVYCFYELECKEYALQTCGGTLTATSNDKVEENTKIFPHTVFIQGLQFSQSSVNNF